jgi:hypothetical protein
VYEQLGEGRGLGMEAPGPHGPVLRRGHSQVQPARPEQENEKGHQESQNLIQLFTHALSKHVSPALMACNIHYTVSG